MTDLDRLFRVLVGNIVAGDPDDLHRPIRLFELVNRYLPYRANRRAIGVDSSEDHEALLLRFFAGEGGLARVEPDEVRARFAAELRSATPDLGLLAAHGDAGVTLDRAAVAHVLATAPEDAYAPPAPPPAPEASPAPRAFEPDDALLHDAIGFSRESHVDLVALDHGALDQPGAPTPAGPPARPPANDRCECCSVRLPTGRAVHFCPQCGQRQGIPRCRRCHADVEPEWRYCVDCGAPVRG